MFLKILCSLVLPITVVLVVPFLLVYQSQPFGVKYNLPLSYLQIPAGLVIILIGLALLIMTIRLFADVGKGTLAPWDPPRHLVVKGVYRYMRNPMIAGVLFMLLGETVLLGSRLLLTWFAFALIVNTIYFKLLEEPGLVKRFGGEYEIYRKNVPMWIPRLKLWEPEDVSFPGSLKQ